MRDFLIAVLVLLLSHTNIVDAEVRYNGTLIDAHSQVGERITAALVSKQINKTDVDYTLLSFRLRKVETTFLTIKKLTKNKVKYLIPTKLRGFTRKKVNRDRAINQIIELKKSAEQKKIEYAGFGEIIVQHAPHNHKKLQYDGINLDLDSERISRVINIVLKDKKPVILHVELKDFPKDSQKILKQIITMGNRFPENEFLLMHMAQIEVSDAKTLFEKTKNVHLVTSHADNEAQRRIKLGKAQQGWINLFNSEDNIKDQWLDLMNRNPERFVFALDNVWDGHWLKGYRKRVSMWRKALASLDDGVAVSIACKNANRYFQLGIECQEDRSK